MNLKKVRLSEDEIEIFINNRSIGTIFQGWLRNGGSGWTMHNVHCTFKTQKEAIKRLIKKVKDQEDPGCLHVDIR